MNYVCSELGTDYVHGAAQTLIGDRAQDQAGHIVEVHPRKILAAVAESSAERQLEGQEHSRQCPAVPSAHHAHAKKHDAQAELFGFARLFLPAHAQIGEEARSCGVGLSLKPLALGVPPDGRGIDEDRRLLLDAAERLDERPRGCQAMTIFIEPPFGLNSAATADSR